MCVCVYPIVVQFFQIYGASSSHNHFKLVQQTKQGRKDSVEPLSHEILFLVTPLGGNIHMDYK